MSHRTRVLLFSVLLLISACAQPTQQSIDSSVATAVAATVGANATPTQLPGVALGPPAT
ncbi:MAG: hypothetical protein HQ477_11435 [Chloroflexi bacterium]|nr:hypothetical protein [Chloroflexota bacterium]